MEQDPKISCLMELFCFPHDKQKGTEKTQDTIRRPVSHLAIKVGRPAHEAGTADDEQSSEMITQHNNFPFSRSRAHREGERRLI